MRAVKYRVSNGQETTGYEMVVDGMWFCSNGGVNWANGTYFGDRLKRWQTTGLYDVVNKEIFEGDIVVVDGKRCIVVWVQSEAGFRYQPEFSKQNYYVMNYNGDEKVIGVIYENPELMEVSNAS